MENANPTILAATDLPTRTLAAPPIKDDDPLVMIAHRFPTDNLCDPLEAAAGEESLSDSDSTGSAEPIDEQEIYDLIATISDPEHPLSLGSLAVVSLPDIRIEPMVAGSSLRLQRVKVLLTPTVNHCSLATVIGLGVRVRLEQALPPRYRVDVRIKPGTHASAEEVNKQLADKERVAAALENRQLWGVLRKMMETCV